jgi:polyene macrolide polyketide synthase
VRRAGVNSFGISGTNAHAILEEAPEEPTPSLPAERTLPPTVPLLVSAADHAALIDQASRLAEHLDQHPETSVVDLAYTLAARTHHPARLAAALAPDEQAAAVSASLRGFVQGESSQVFTGVVAPRPGKLVVLFSGQGSQRPEMGSRLYSQYPQFREALEQICAELDRTLQRPLREVLFAPPDTEDSRLLDQTEYTQPALFAVSVALYRQWEAWGLVPDMLLGHSIGELAAAHVAGVLSLEDACRLVATRGRLMQRARGGGAMFAIAAMDTEVAELILGLEDRVSIAAVNGPEQTVLSGDMATAEAIVDELARMGRRVQRLRVSHAFHSPHMDGILDEYRQVARTLTYHAPRIAMLSNLNGAIAGERVASAEYWVRQLRGAVRFRDAIRTAESAGADRYIECGPGTVLSAMVAGCVQGASASFIPSLGGEGDEAESLGTALACAHVAGVALRWDRVFAGLGARRVDLPNYSFQRKRYWLESAGHPEGVVEGAGLSRVAHEILSAHTSLPEGGHLFTARLSRLRVPWLADHELLGRVVVPAMSIADLLLAAGSRVGASQLSSLFLEAPLILDSPMKLLLRLEPADEQGQHEFALYACTTGAGGDGPWTRHGTGSLESAAPMVEHAMAAPPADATAIDLGDLYQRLARKGLGYGPGFRGLREVKRWGHNLHARLELPARLQPHGYAIHPAILDAGFHALLAIAGDDAELRVPFELRQMWVARAESSPRALRVHLVVHEVDAAGMPLEARMHFEDESGEPVASLGWVGLRAISLDKLREPPRAPARSRRALEGQLYGVQWVAQPARGRVGGCAVVGSGSLSNEVAAALRHSGVPVVRFNRTEDTQERMRQQDAGITTIVRVLEPVEAGEAEAALQAVIDLAQELTAWTAGNPPVDHRYVLLTSRAVATAAGDAPALAHAPLWGLLRTVRSETSHEQWILLDTDATEASHRALAAALTADEVEAALRQGERLVPRLARVDAEAAAAPPIHGTVLVSGGTSGLGAEVAKHLAAAGEVKHLLLLSRQGTQAPGAPALAQQIESMGCGVTFAAADVADRDAVQRALEAVPAALPLTGVFHCAAVLDDALAPSADRITRVFAAKAIGAWNLHQLTSHHDLKEFVLFSSIAGLIGNEGQSAYAAANTFLDALSASRRALGLPAHSLAWGTWAEVGMAARLSARHQERIQRAGFAPLSVDSALDLMDRALRSPHPLLVPLRVDEALLRSKDASTPLGRLLFGTAPPSPGREPKAAKLSLRERIDAALPAERGPLLLDLVRTEVAAVLKLPNAEDLHEEKPLEELGMDSLMGVDIRRRLEKRLGMQLPPTVVFDHPSCGRLASYLLASWNGAT